MDIQDIAKKVLEVSRANTLINYSENKNQTRNAVTKPLRHFGV